MSINNTSNALIITLSDRAAAGIYDDQSGSLCGILLQEAFSAKNSSCFIERKILPDSATQLRETVLQAVAKDIDIIITTGGTGIGPRDITPETIQPLFDKEITGIMELVRVKYGMVNPNAVISRSIAGTIGTSLVYCLPGSPKAVREYMAEICQTLHHSLRMVLGSTDH